MQIDEAARHELYTTLTKAIEPQNTSTLMSLLPPVGWADVATKDDLRALESALRGELRGELGELRGELGELRGELHTDVSRLRAEMHQGFAAQDVRWSAALRTQLFAIIAAMCTVATLTVAATAAVV